MISPGSFCSNSPYSGNSYAPSRPYGIKNYGVQSYLPINEKRELEKSEEKEVKKNLRNFWPKIGAGYSTPIPELLASPIWSAVGGAIGTGLTIGLLGAICCLRKALPLFIGGSVIGAVIGAFTGFISRRRQNENILDIMKRLPPNSTKRDLLSDPVYQKDRELAAMKGANTGGDIFTGVMLGSMMNGMNSSSTRGR